MLFISLLLILAGVVTISAAIISITYMILTNGEKKISYILRPTNWSDSMRKWLQYGGIGLAATLFGMILTMLGT